MQLSAPTLPFDFISPAPVGSTLPTATGIEVPDAAASGFNALLAFSEEGASASPAVPGSPIPFNALIGDGRGQQQIASPVPGEPTVSRGIVAVRSAAQQLAVNASHVPTARIADPSSAPQTEKADSSGEAAAEMPAGGDEREVVDREVSSDSLIAATVSQIVAPIQIVAPSTPSTDGLATVVAAQNDEAGAVIESGDAAPVNGASSEYRNERSAPATSHIPAAAPDPLVPSEPRPTTAEARSPSIGSAAQGVAVGGTGPTKKSPAATPVLDARSIERSATPDVAVNSSTKAAPRVTAQVQSTDQPPVAVNAPAARSIVTAVRVAQVDSPSGVILGSDRPSSPTAPLIGVYQHSRIESSLDSTNAGGPASDSVSSTAEPVARVTRAADAAITRSEPATIEAAVKTSTDGSVLAGKSSTVPAESQPVAPLAVSAVVQQTSKPQPTAVAGTDAPRDTSAVGRVSVSDRVEDGPSSTVPGSSSPQQFVSNSARADATTVAHRLPNAEGIPINVQVGLKRADSPASPIQVADAATSAKAAEPAVIMRGDNQHLPTEAAKAKTLVSRPLEETTRVGSSFANTISGAIPAGSVEQDSSRSLAAATIKTSPTVEEPVPASHAHQDRAVASSVVTPSPKTYAGITPVGFVKTMENFAASSAPIEMRPAFASKPSIKKSLAASVEPLVEVATVLGTNVAKPSASMVPPASSTSPTTASVEPASFTAVPVTFESAGEEAGASPTEFTQATRRAVESAMAVAEQFTKADQKSVNLQFTVSGMELAVRVELRGENVHTTFRTDSPDLRNALAHEWQAVAASQTGDRSQKLADPVFTSASTSSSLNSDSGAASQQREFGHRQSAMPPEYAAFRTAPARAAAASSAVPTQPVHVAPSTSSRRLNTFA